MSEVKHIVLFDGVCNLCNSSVQFVVKRDKKAQLHYASLQSKVGQDLLAKYKIDTKNVDSIVFVSNGKAYIESTAALKIAGFLQFPYNLLQVFIVIPTFIRNLVYRWIARNRYRWFGKEEVCMMPDASISARFLDTKSA
jgi:predicted DCC family thiol-disulfide oxidoreductase YuxK